MGQSAVGEVLEFPASQSIQAARLAWREVVMALSAMYLPEGQLVQLVEDKT